MDEYDRSILRALQADASQSVETIASRAHLSRNACWRRIKALEDRGVIRARVALVDPEAVGAGLSALVLIRTSDHDPHWQERFTAAVRGMPEVVGAHRMTGELDYVLRVRVADVKDYDRFYNSLIRRVPISDISASFVMDDIKETTVVPV